MVLRAVTFDPAAFAATVRTAVLGVSRALVERRPELARRFMTDAALATLQAQVEALVSQDASEHRDGLLVTDVNVQRASSDAAGEEAVARVGLSAENYVVNSAGVVLAGFREISMWHEDWTFVRKVDPASDAAAAAQCPLCGAPYQLDDDGRCVYCHAPMPGRPTDWLVSSIARVFTPPAPGQDDVDQQGGLVKQVAPGAFLASGTRAIFGTPVQDTPLDPFFDDRAGADVAHISPTPVDVDPAAGAGVEAIKAHDPAFSPADVIAQARETVNLLEAARSALDPGRARALLNDATYAAEVERADQARAAGRNTLRAYLEVTGARLSVAATNASWDEVVVTVATRAAEHVIDLRSGALVSGSDELVARAEDVMLVRSAAARTDPLRTPDSSLCPACLAAFAVDAAGNCLACRRHVTGGEFGWVAAGVRISDLGAPSPVTRPSHD